MNLTVKDGKAILEETQTTKPVVRMTKEQFVTMQAMIHNDTMTLSREMLNRLLTPQSEIDTACGYTQTLTITEYRTMYNRMGLAKRAVGIWPEECWQAFPEIYESESKDETEFEKQWKDLQVRLSLFSYLFRVDVLSGIGSYGILLLGLDDGKNLMQPVDGINEITGEPEPRKLLYLRAFDESVLTVDAVEKNITSPRYGMPTIYSVKYQEEGQSGINYDFKVHWSRVIHIADNREMSETRGVSRLQGIYNNLYDIKKVSGGSGEMFWKGGFPGYAFEITPEAAAMGAEIDAESVKEQMVSWATGLQRWLAITGVTTKSLTPQVADPTGHVEVHLKLIAVSLGVPYRVLLGSEEAKLASVQDKRTWNGRVASRQNSYLTPLVIRPFIDRLIALGCLAKPAEYFVDWPDLNAATDDDVAKVALARTEAFAKYVAGGVNQIIPPRPYLTQIHKMTEAEVNAIEKEVGDFEDIMSPEEKKAEALGQQKVDEPAPQSQSDE
jgi:hypothetical protein